MKKAFCFIGVFISILLVGCGRDGSDGTPFLAYNWVFQPYNFTDSNNDMPHTILRGNFYLTHAGTYYFSYTSDGYSYRGSYTITINEGEKSKLHLKNGEDGANSYFSLGLWSTGPICYNLGPNPVYFNSIAKYLDENYLPESDVNEIEKGRIFARALSSLDPDGEDVIVQELNQGKYKVVLEYIAIE